MSAQHSYSRQMLVSALQSRGFEVERPLKATVQSAIFCVREISAPAPVGLRGPSPYVAKVVPLTGLDAQGRAAALQEVSVLRGIAKHPNLIEYRDSFLEEAAGVLLIVMSFAENGDLRGVVANAQAMSRVLPEPAVLWWLKQMLAGLDHLHSQGVVHRDLKTSNIFLCEGRRHIRIGDFGISRVLESTAFATSCVGTPAYMSPELMRNEQYDYHVDMWALGCISFELCALHLPFSAKSLLDLVYQVVEADPDWTLWEPSFSDELKAVALRLLSKDVKDRPTSTEVLGEPLFATGRGSMPPDEMVWDRVPEGNEEPDALSQITEGSGRASDTWTSTPRMPWETGSLRASDTSITQASLAGTSDQGSAVASLEKDFLAAREQLALDPTRSLGSSSPSPAQAPDSPERAQALDVTQRQPPKVRENLM